jgi:Ca2+-binding RTX toxin-like protein
VTGQSAGTDTLISIEDIIAGGGDDTLTGDDNANLLDGGSGSNVINGGGGDDTIRDWGEYYPGSGCQSTIDGGTGADALLLYRAYATSAINVSFTPGSSTPVVLPDGTSFVNIERLHLLTGSGNDSLTFNGIQTSPDPSTMNYWEAGAGNDTLTVDLSAITKPVTLYVTGGNGDFISDGAPILGFTGVENFSIVGTAGNDVLYTADGNDTIDGGAGDDVISGGTGNNVLIGGDGNDAIYADPGNNTISGGNGTDTLLPNNATGGVTLNLAITTSQDVGGGMGSMTISGIENAWGTNFNDVLIGDAGNNTLYGSGGDDTFDGGAGDDVFNGGSGSDTVTYADATSGVTVSLATTAPQAVGGGMGTDTLIGIENLEGSDGNDTLTGNSGDNVLWGGMGDNTLDGGAGNDTVSYERLGGMIIDLDQGTAQSFVGAPPVHDTLSNIENVIGSDSTDVITASASTASISAGAGGDTVYVKGYLTPSMRLDGGDGADTLVLNGDYASGLTLQPNTISNFERITLTSGFNYKLTLANGNIGAGTYTTVYSTDSGTVVLDASAETSGHLGFSGGGAQETVTGTTNDDTFYFSPTTLQPTDALNGGGGSDTLVLVGDFSGGFTFLANTMKNVENIRLGAFYSYSITTNDGNVAAGQQLNVYTQNGIDVAHTVTFDGSAETDGTFNFIISSGQGTLTGGAGADTFIVNATVGSYRLVGGAGNDTFDLSAHPTTVGVNTLDGGDGTDTARFSGNMSAYTITRQVNGSCTISGPDGTDTLIHVERAAFADQTITLTRQPRQDFAGSGTSSILWKSAATGQYAIWQMNGTTPTSGGFTSIQPGSEWTIIGGGDFNGDGKADLLWKNTTTNQKAVWFMNGTTVAGGDFLSVQAGSEWSIIGTGDFSGDGKTDLLWKNANTGQLAVWLIDGTTVSGGGFTSIQTGAEWNVLGTGDFNGDGKADILWKNTNTGQIAMWFMDGTNVLAGGGFTSIQAGSEWSMLNTGDFNGDGKTDLLWKNTNTGQMAVWLMDGTTVAGGGFTGAQAGNDWSITGIGDYNGDGNADILWRNTNTGAPAVWLMSGTNVLAGSGFAGSNPGTNWSIISGNGG